MIIFSKQEEIKATDFARFVPINEIISNKEDIEIIFSNDATVAKDDNLKRKTVVRKCDLDKDDDEKAVLYALAKLNGYTPRDIARFIKKAKDFRVNDKKDWKIKRIVLNYFKIQFD